MCSMECITVLLYDLLFFVFNIAALQCCQADKMYQTFCDGFVHTLGTNHTLKLQGQVPPKLAALRQQKKHVDQ